MQTFSNNSRKNVIAVSYTLSQPVKKATVPKGTKIFQRNSKASKLKSTVKHGAVSLK